MSEPDVWILVDPVQDYEESLEILGVYDSAEEAMASPHVTSFEGDFTPARIREAQRWVGDQMKGLWRYQPARGGWVWDTR